MSRSGYCDDMDDDLALGRWRGQVASAIRGKRGQALLKDMLAALDAMPAKRLVADTLVVSGCEPDLIVGGDELVARDGTVCAVGDVCALGALAKARGLSVDGLNPENAERVADVFDIAEPLAREIVYMNDEAAYRETPEQRWVRVRAWVAQQIKADPGPISAG